MTDKSATEDEARNSLCPTSSTLREIDVVEKYEKNGPPTITTHPGLNCYGKVKGRVTCSNHPSALKSAMQMTRRSRLYNVRLLQGLVFTFLGLQTMIL